MKKSLTVIALGTLVLSACDGSAVSFGKVDTDADGRVTLEEAVAGVPDMTPAEFTAADAYGDGGLSAQEFESAMASKS